MTFVDNVASETRIGLTGQLYKGELGAAKPGSPTQNIAAVDPSYVGLGFFSDDGVTESWEDSVTHIYPWQGTTPVRSVRTETLTTFQFKPIQTRGSVLQTFHPGSYVEDLGGGVYQLEIGDIVPDRSTWIFDAVDGDIHYRYWIPAGEITERGEVMFNNGEAIGYPMTLTCYKDDTTGLTLVKLSDDVNWADGIAAS